MARDPEETENTLRSGIDVAIFLPNVILIGIVLLVIGIFAFGRERVLPLVATDRKTAAQIERLEREVSRKPTGTGVFKLARLYQRAGETPWSYDALRTAEQRGGDDPRWRIKLALAYLEIGKNRDGRRVLRESIAACKVRRCGAGERARLEIFLEIAERFVAQKIDARRNVREANAVLDKVLKRVDATKLVGLRRGTAAGSAAGSGEAAKGTTAASQPAQH